MPLLQGDILIFTLISCRGTYRTSRRREVRVVGSSWDNPTNKLLLVPSKPMRGHSRDFAGVMLI